MVARPSAKSAFVRRSQRAQRAASLQASNARLKARRTVVVVFNSLLEEIGADALTLDRKAHPAAETLERVLRVLDRRCVTDSHKERFERAVRQWVDNAGLLPEGIVLREDNALHMSADVGEEAAFLPKHRLLLRSFAFKSKAFMLTYNSDTLTEASWPALRDHAKDLARRLGARAWSACIEASLKSTVASVHGHEYFMWTDGIGYRTDDLDDLRFQGIRPRVDQCVAGTSNHRSPRRAALHGLWYVAIMKLGTIAADTNHVAWRDYTPSREWLLSLFDAQKLTPQQFLHLSAEFGSGHASRRRDAHEVLRDRCEEAVSKHVRREAAAIATELPRESTRTFPAIETFVECFRAAAHRRPILLLVGGTNLGKSMLAESVLQRIGVLLGVPGYVEVTVEDDACLDLSSFRVDEHAGVLLDGIADVLMLKRNREALQGRAKVCRGGRSATMLYAYPFSLARRAVVATMDLSARNLHLLRTDHWLSDSRNIIQVWLRRPAWITENETTDAPMDEAPSSVGLAGWGVEELAAHIAGEDAEGLASQLRQNSVNGADFAELTAEDFVKQLHFTPFAAKKLHSLREKFLLHGF